MTNTVNITIGNAATVVLPVKANTIKSTVRQGKDLVIHLTNGQTLILENYFENEPKLLANGEVGTQVEQLAIDTNGNLLGTQPLSAAEVEAAVGAKNIESLSTQTSDVLLFTPSSTGAVGNYTTEVLVASAVVLGGMIWAGSRNDKSAPSQGTKETIEKKDTDGDGTLDTTIKTITDKNGNVISTETSVDKNGDGKPESVTTETKKT